MLGKLKEFEEEFLEEVSQLLYNNEVSEDVINRENFYDMFSYMLESGVLNESYSHLIKDTSYLDLSDIVIILEKKYGDDVVNITAESLKNLKKKIDEEMTFDELNEMLLSGNIPVNIVDDAKLIKKDDKIYSLSKLFGYKIKKPLCKKEKIRDLKKIKITPLYGYLKYYLNKLKSKDK